MNRPWVRLYFVHPGDARGWIALGCYSLVLVVLGMIAASPSILDQDAFLILATAIIITGWVQGPVGWAYQATKGGGEAAESSARIAEKAAEAAVSAVGPSGTKDDPMVIEGAPEGSEPVTTKPRASRD
jgi:hypothetical protein